LDDPNNQEYLRQVALCSRGATFKRDLEGKPFEQWMTEGIANGDRILSTDPEGGKHVTLFYDGSKGDLEDLQSLREKFAAHMPVFNIKYRPRAEC